VLLETLVSLSQLTPMELNQLDNLLLLISYPYK
jgi:hypothetical protein